MRSHFEMVLRKGMLTSGIATWGELCKETGFEPRRLLVRREHPETLRLSEVQILADAVNVPAMTLLTAIFGGEHEKA